MKPRLPRMRRDPAKEIESAQLSLVETALLGFIESVDGKVPTDDEILAHGMHARFSDTPLCTFKKDGHSFVMFYVWRQQHAVALGFLDPKNPLALSAVRVAREDWPAALAAYVAQHGAGKEGA